MKVSSSQYGVFFGDQLHLPCSIATVVGYALQFVDMDLQPTFVDKRNIDADAEACRDSDWLLCSCYCWNWRATNRLARRAKELNPRLKVVFGGPEVPDHAEGFFERHSYVDVLVHGEGEVSLSEVLQADSYYRRGGGLVLGIETREGKGLPRERIKDLESIPSPFTTGLMWKLAERSRYRWVASWESNRGCPFACT
jgi:radical SAM superfamily enzyme YgiQ (UPF0313 family)